MLFGSAVPSVYFQVDQDLSRTVLVTTKLDTKLPQFGSGEDLEDFLRRDEAFFLSRQSATKARWTVVTTPFCP